MQTSWEEGEGWGGGEGGDLEEGHCGAGCGN